MRLGIYILLLRCCSHCLTPRYRRGRCRRKGDMVPSPRSRSNSRETPQRGPEFRPSRTRLRLGADHSAYACPRRWVEQLSQGGRGSKITPVAAHVLNPEAVCKQSKCFCLYKNDSDRKTRPLNSSNDLVGAHALNYCRKSLRTVHWDVPSEALAKVIWGLDSLPNILIAHIEFDPPVTEMLKI